MNTMKCITFLISCSFLCSPLPSSPQTDPLALWPGHLWDRTGRCNRRSSWPAPPDCPRCSRGKWRGTTCWTSEWEQTSRTCLSFPGPCSSLSMRQSVRSLCCLHQTRWSDWHFGQYRTCPKFKSCKHFHAIRIVAETYAKWTLAEGAEPAGQVTCCSGSQHASVVDAHWAIGAAHGQVVRHQRRDGYRGGCSSTVYQDILK